MQNVQHVLEDLSFRIYYLDWFFLIFRYQYDVNAPGAASQLRLASTGDLNLNISVCNANTIFQAYASWNNLSNVKESYQANLLTLINILARYQFLHHVAHTFKDIITWHYKFHSVYLLLLVHIHEILPLFYFMLQNIWDTLLE